MSRFTFFWQSESPFSQWHLSRFELDGHVYVTAEQWMMASKARLFGDEEIERRILGTPSPREQKAFGRKVRGFVPATWEAEREAIVYRGNHATSRPEGANRQQPPSTPSCSRRCSQHEGPRWWRRAPWIGSGALAWQQITPTRRIPSSGADSTCWEKS